MKLQEKILREFQQTFPNETLRNISELTGIQLTRVFRLMNGSAMKLDEYESFLAAIESQLPAAELQQGFDGAIYQARRKLPLRELQRIADFVERRLRWNELTSNDSKHLTVATQTA